MSAIFKEYIVPKLNTASFNAPETKAILQVLKVMDNTDNDAYLMAKTAVNNQYLKAVFTNNVAQQIYYHPKVYANKKHGLGFIASWLPLLENGFYPDEKSANKLVEFLYFSLNYFQSEALSENIKNQVFQVLKALVQSKSEASLPVSRFLIHRVFDIRDVLSSDFIIQHCITHHILSNTYAVVNSDKELMTLPFQINKDFVISFYEGDWHALVKAIHQVLPVGRVYMPGAYVVMQPWFSTELAEFYNVHLELAHLAHQAIKERFIFGEAHSFELLNLKTSNNLYPLITALGSKVWDAGDVLLFSNRDKNIPQAQLDASYLRFIDWLNADGGSNFHTEAFQDYGKHILSNATAATLPLQCLLFWFNSAHRQSYITNQTETYSSIFSKILLACPKGKLPVMRFENKSFQLTGTFLITDVFQITSNLNQWLLNFKNSGINNPLNQFLVLTFYDARQNLSSLYNTENQEVLQAYLLEMAYSTENANNAICKKNLPFIVKTLASLCVESGNFTRVNQIWALKSMDTGVTDMCNDFARGHYINENRPLNLNLIQAWFNYLSDFYYSSGQEAIWVPDVLTTQGVRTANYCNSLENQVSYFLERAINHILSFHKKCKLHEATNSVLAITATQIEIYLTDFLKTLDTEKLSKNTVAYLYNYRQIEGTDFTNQKELPDIIATFYHFHFKQEQKTTSTVYVEQIPASSIEIELVKMAPEYINSVLYNLENYGVDGVCKTQLLETLNERIQDFKAWLLNDESGIEARFCQALYMTLLDKNLAPGTDLETYGNLCKSLFVHLVKDTKMANSYAMGLKTMANSGAYPKGLTTGILQIIDNLNA